MDDIVERLRNPAWIHSHISVSATAELDQDQVIKDMGDAADKIEHLNTFIEFVLLWMTRDKVTNAERVSVVKHHPFLQDMIAERAAVTAGDRDMLPKDGTQ